MMRKFKYSLVAFVAVVFLVSSAQAFFWGDDDDDDAENIVELGWEDLIPEGFTPAASPLEQMTQEQVNKLFDGSEESNQELEEIEKIMSFAPTVADLDGKQVKLPAYVVPLDFDGQTNLTEFLLVPYYGACIHTPPPPANQVVHANAKQAVVVEDTYRPVWAIGTMSTETIQSNLAEAGYQLKVDRLEPYEVD